MKQTSKVAVKTLRMQIMSVFLCLFFSFVKKVLTVISLNFHRVL